MPEEARVFVMKRTNFFDDFTHSFYLNLC